MNLLNTPIKFNQLELPNRLVMPPMATAKSAEDGTVTSQLCNYYAEKSQGGYIGLIITEHSFISPEGKAHNGQLSICKDSDITGLRALVNTIHQNHTKVFAQISHAGGAARQEETGCEVLSSSAVSAPRWPADKPLPRAMTLEEIQKVIKDFTMAAVRAKEAGFDGVEIHSAHGYLLNQFYSPYINKRTDAYNGSTLEGRIRLHLEIIEAVRDAVGTDYPIALRLGACDYMEDGSTKEDCVAAAKAFEAASIDLLDISGGLCGYVRPGVTEQGYFSELTEAIKQEISIPVLLTGGITDGKAANQLLEDGKADLIGVGRAILKDSSWAKNNILSSEA